MLPMKSFKSAENVCGYTTTYLGGSGPEIGNGIAVDVAGAAYIAGETGSPDFPTTVGAVQPAFGGWFEDAFVAELAPDGATVLYGTYLGGIDFDIGSSLAVDATGAAYVTGPTNAADFPTTPDVVQSTFVGVQDAFVAKLTPDGTALVYSTYLGGSQPDSGQGIAINAIGAAYPASAGDS